MAPDSTTAPTISVLRPGQDVDGVFACTRKDRLKTRAGSPYLALELRDRTGALSARAFQGADALAGPVRARRSRPRARPGGALPRRAQPRGVGHRAVAADDGIDPARFLPTAYRDLDELDGFLEHLAGEVYDRAYAELLRRPARRRRAAGAVAPGAVQPGRPPRLSGRPARAHGGGGHAGPRGLPAAPGAELRPADLRRARSRPRPHARVHLRRRDRADRGGAAPGPPGHRRADALRARRRRAGRRAADWRCCTACCATTGRPRRREGALPRPRRWRCTGSTRWTRGSRARWSTGSAPTEVGGAWPRVDPASRSARRPARRRARRHRAHTALPWGVCCRSRVMPTAQSTLPGSPDRALCGVGAGGLSSHPR